MARRLAFLAFAATLMFAAASSNADPAMPGMPPNIQKIMDKLQSGQPTTPAEQKALQDWSMGLAGIKPGSPEAQAVANAGAAAPSGEAFSVGSGEDRNPCHKGGHVAFSAAPSREAYLAMAKDAMRVYRGALDPDAFQKLNSTLAASANPSLGGDLALILVAGGNGAGGVVSAAYAAQRNPSDPVTANNLGTVLRGMHDYVRAAIALQYARSRVPDSPVIANNLGWLAMSKGDMNTADGLFKAALGKNGQLSSSLAGRGLVALCSGKPAQALPLFRASIRNGFSDLAAAGIESAEDDIANAKSGGGSIGTPDAYGAEGSPGDLPDWPEPPFPSSTAAFVGLASQRAPAGAFFVFENYWTGLIGAGYHGDVEQAHTERTGNKLTFTRGYDKEDFVLGDIRRMLSAMMDRPVDDFVAGVDTARHSAGCNTCATKDDPDALARAQAIEKCVYRPRADAAHQALFPKQTADWTLLRQRFSDLYAFSRPWLERIHDGNTLRDEKWENTEIIASHGGAFASAIPVWGGEALLDFNEGKCGYSATKVQKPQPIKPYKIDPTKCRSGSMALNFGLANFRADCDQMVLTFGEGLVFAGQYKFAPDYTADKNGVLHPAQGWSDDQLTIFAGAGTSGVGPLTANAAAGGFVSVQNGHMVDYGGQAQAGITVGNGEETPATWQGGAVARLGAVSGVDVSTSGGIRVGGNCGVSC